MPATDATTPQCEQTSFPSRRTRYGPNLLPALPSPASLCLSRSSPPKIQVTNCVPPACGCESYPNTYVIPKPLVMILPAPALVVFSPPHLTRILPLTSDAVGLGLDSAAFPLPFGASRVRSCGASASLMFSALVMCTLASLSKVCRRCSLGSRRAPCRRRSIPVS